ncbi:hypothetical protein HNQ90_002191 [Algibacter amylolyticus]|nr:hypothetical protein [Algibacter amylolyticus]
MCEFKYKYQKVTFFSDVKDKFFCQYRFNKGFFGVKVLKVFLFFANTKN